MIKGYLKGILVLFFFIFVLGGCSSSQLTSELKDEKIAAVDINSYIPSETTTFSITDTSHIRKEIESKLEIARQHYVSALEAYEKDDSTNSAKEFEEAIRILDQLSYYPDIESIEEFNELSKSLVEDYDKFIASIDELGPDTPIFALREKINTEAEMIDVNKEVIPVPKQLPQTQVPLVINESVKQFLSFFINNGKKFVPTWFYRSGYYFPMMKRIFAEEGLPQELIYLSMVESGLNPAARSFASAVGLWQFIKSTGKLYGLNADFWIDDRRDPEKATRAAARHLKDLYDIYQDWYLVLAAYNSGGGRVNSAIRRSRSNDFWEIAPKLPKETRGYVPQYIAISLIFMNPEEYGFTNLQYAEPFQCDTVTINGCYDLEVLAEAAGIDPNELKLINPELVQSCTPPAMSYPLKVPKDKTEVFAATYKQIPPDKRRVYLVHVVKKGETISSVANKYNISKTLLAELNGLEKYLKNRKRLPRDIAIKVPLKTSSLIATKAQENPSQNEELIDEKEQLSEDTQNHPSAEPKNKLKGELDKIRINYQVKEGDNLKSIAAMYDVRISDIRNWNDIPFGQEIDEIDSLDIWIPKSRLALYQKINVLNSAEKEKLVSTKSALKQDHEKSWFTHKVKKGESLGKIADKYNISLTSLKKWNNLKKNSISTGKALKIYGISPNASYATNATTSKEKSSHKVQKNETLYSIAKTNNVKVAELLEWNNLTETDKIKPGQILKTSPTNSTSKKEKPKAELVTNKPPKANTAETLSNYKVKRGDNLSSIAEAYGVTINDIRNWNNISGNNIKIGQVLKLQANVPSTSKGDNEKPKTSAKKEYYKVKSGDTLYGISKKFNVEISELQKWNKIKSLKAGDRIVVYR